ncbi:hypothetical protein AVEN_113422-2-1, partial [Araneus ventricosus]
AEVPKLWYSADQLGVEKPQFRAKWMEWSTDELPALKSKTPSADSNLGPRCEDRGRTKDLPTLGPRVEAGSETRNPPWGEKEE